ncbi:hypothetical protein GKIL_0235 [Gloeobacter kilaueensis JS1]|uniref:Glycosyltransferase n=2 Tax=Gloeobacter TaxID=33071 RepID=U5QC49_GLOK1|nr:hypothetical protein GKIL_0235 [Gloeobacter kilaueensis JS1]
MAKAPEAGRVKTRLCPPLTPMQAACLHEALLLDTLTLVRALPAHRYLAYSGPRLWFDRHCPEDVCLFEQQGVDLAERLDRAVRFVLSQHRPLLCIGSDSPHLGSAYLRKAAERLVEHPVVLGPALDGGYCLVGLNTYQPLFIDMPMSTDQLLTKTLDRCRALDLSAGLLPMQGDFDTWADVENLRSKLDDGHTLRLLEVWDTPPKL